MKDFNYERLSWAIAICFVVYFGRSMMLGLAPDAALYAGLARYVAESGEPWFLRGLSMFPVFFEHPPYFFQWGGALMSIFGFSDAVARAMGAVPTLLALVVLVLWLWKRHSWKLSAWTLFSLLTFGHFTKYTATSMLEAPLTLGALLFSIGTFEFFFRYKNEQKYLWLAALGAAISFASKGVVSVLIWGGLGIYVIFFVPKDSTWLKRKGLWFFYTGLGLFVPALLWFVFAWDGDSSIALRYLNEQVLGSYSTNRGQPELYDSSWSFFTYGFYILKYAWPWWWAVPLGFIWLRKQEPYSELFLKSWVKLALCVFGVLYAVFSTSHVRLPHYLHPSYILLSPVFGYVLYRLVERFIAFEFQYKTLKSLRWGLFAFVLVFMVFQFRGVTSSSNRGQEFIKIKNLLERVDPSCKVIVSKDQMDQYRMEAFSLWYFGGRPYELVSHNAYVRSLNRMDEGAIWWEPKNDVNFIHPSCELSSSR